MLVWVLNSKTDEVSHFLKKVNWMLTFLIIMSLLFYKVTHTILIWILYIFFREMLICPDLIWKLVFGYSLNFYLKIHTLHIPLISSNRRWIKSYHNLTLKKILSTLKFWTITDFLQHEFQ